MNKKYNFKLCEEKSNLIKYQNDFLYKNNSYEKKDKIFSIILPPPNVTGQLHLGHSWNGTIQDCMIKYKKIQGYKVNWICGMDHAGIATQTKFEKEIKNKDLDFYLSIKDNSKKLFSEINKWKNKNKNSIKNQWKKMGFALNYDNEYFTLDDNFSYYIDFIFVDLYKKNFIYKDYKLVNWDVKLKTAISDIEVIHKEVEINFYYIKYFAENKKDFVIVATTRPETIFVDVCLATNPQDTRYKKNIGKNYINPLTNTLIPMIGDKYVDKNFGTGVLKLTPAHDFNDYEINKKHLFEYFSCINFDGKLNDKCGKFSGLDRIKSRKEIIKFLDQKKLLLKKETIKSNVGYSERTLEVVEPLLSKQWFLDLKKIKSNFFQSNEIFFNNLSIHPKKFLKQFINWIKVADDWCISRQLVWGHQLPVWYNKKNKNDIYVNVNPPKDKHNWLKETDVLDTWFSSSLIPLVVSDSLKKQNSFFPTSLLVTGYDIIFFWVIKMIFFSIYYLKKIPFDNIYITGIMRDSAGKKMSKSLGNGILPEEIIKKYGADSLRLFLLSSSSPGEDLKFSIEKIEFNWSFLNKLWNLIRFLINENITFCNDNFFKENCSFFDLWILNKFNKSYENYQENFNKLNFNIVINNFKNFIWEDLCNTYFEMNKLKIKQNKNIQLILFYLLRNILIMLHPFVPFFSQYIYSLFLTKKNEYILNEKLKIEKSIEKEKLSKNLFFIIHNINKFKLKNNVKSSEIIKINIFLKKNSFYKNILKNEDFKFFLSVNKIEICEIHSKVILNKIKFISFLNDDLIFEINNSDNYTKIPLFELEKNLDKIYFEINRSQNILSNQNFLKKAPKEKVLKEKDKLKNYIDQKNETLSLIQNLKK